MSGSDGIRGRTRIAIADRPRGWIERTATIEDADESIVLGVSPGWYEKYGVSVGEFDVHATTNDVFAAAIASCMTGVFAAALEARSIVVTPETLSVVVDTEMGPADDEPGWIVRSIRLTFTLQVGADQRAAAQRVVETYHRGCLLSRTMVGSRCELSSELVLAASRPSS